MRVGFWRSTIGNGIRAGAQQTPPHQRRAHNGAAANTAGAPPWYRQFWPWFLLLLPGSVVVAGFVTLGIALRYADNPVRDTYVKDGLAIHAAHAPDLNAQRRHLAATLRLDAAQILLQWHGPAPAPAHLHLQFIHPFDSAGDFSVLLSRDSAVGSYRGVLPQALGGRWRVELADPAAPDWRLRAHIDLRAPQPFTLAPDVPS